MEHTSENWSEEGEILVLGWRYEEALAAFDQTIARKPENARYQLHREQALQALGRASGNTP